MFGHHDDDKKQQDQNEEGAEEQVQDANNTEVTAPEQPSETVAPDTPAFSATTDPDDDQPAVSTDPTWQHPGTPVEEDKPISDVVSPAGGFPRSTGTQISSHHATSGSKHDDLVNPADSDLIDIRQNALSELAPLVDELDLEPEEKFRTLMMVIQASDDQKLVKDAYQAAHAIKDEKVRAQALYDIVNEINYFTTPQSET